MMQSEKLAADYIINSLGLFGIFAGWFYFPSAVRFSRSLLSSAAQRPRCWPALLRPRPRRWPWPMPIIFCICAANQLAAVDPAKIKSPVLVLYAPNDLVFYEPIVRETLQKIAEAGGLVESGTLVGPNGHLDAFTAIGQGADKITAFLAKWQRQNARTVAGG
jgi:pimeloyl-ACP methyl ester carboxylesterase